MKEKHPIVHHNAMSNPQICLENVKKLIDAQIEFNHGLADQLVKSQNKREVCEIILSMHLNLAKTPKPIIIPEDEIFKLYKQIFIKATIHDLYEFQRLKSCADDNPDLDHLYLKIHCLLQEQLINLESTPEKECKAILSHFYNGKNLKLALKQRIRNHSKNSTNSAISADISVLNEMLTLLEPHVSAYCLKFKNSLKILGSVDNKGYINLQNIEKDVHFNQKIQVLLNNYPNYPELHSLLMQYYSFQPNVDPTLRIDENVLTLFKTMKNRDSIKEKIEKILLELKTPLSETDAEKKVPENNAMQKEPDKNCENNLIEQELPLAICLETEKEKAASFPIELRTTDSMLTLEETHEEFGSEYEDEFDEKAPINPYYMFSKKNKKEPVQPKAKHNVLNLKKEHQNTLLEVFDLLPYDYIKLRALVNLTQALGGTMKTSGANRCRIELKNIYAHVLMDGTELTQTHNNENVCNKATVTMHGGGHRSTRSQNNDADKAPDYLIKQFRAAFIRAGFTPENLGLNLENDQQVASNGITKK